MTLDLRDLESAYSESRRNMWVFLIAGVLGALIFGTALSSAISNSDFVKYGDEGQAAIGAIFSALMYAIPLIPFAISLSKNKKLRVQVESMKKRQDEVKYKEPPIKWKNPYESKDEKEYVANDIPKTEEPNKTEAKETGSSPVKEQLKELKSLYDEKLISKAVYDQKQKDIVDKM